MSVDCDSGDVFATFNYALPNPQGMGLYHVQESPKSANFRLNYILDPRKLQIHNLRGQESSFTLDENGFEYLTHRTSEGFVDERSIKTNYYTELQELVKAHTGAKQVFVLGHRIRQSYSTDAEAIEDHGKTRIPSRSVHIDRTPEAVAADVTKYMGNEAESLLQGRVRFINVWRPIGHAVHHEPLGVIDWQTSSDPSNLLTLHVDNVYAQFDLFLSRFRRAHVWYYLGHQTPSEVTLLKCYDSATNGEAKFCLHSSFIHPGCSCDAPRRRSIEVNMLVFG